MLLVFRLSSEEGTMLTTTSHPNVGKETSEKCRRKFQNGRENGMGEI